MHATRHAGRLAGFDRHRVHVELLGGWIAGWAARRVVVVVVVVGAKLRIYQATTDQTYSGIDLSGMAYAMEL